jgi:hypothetical protein
MGTFITLMMKAVCTFETLVYCSETTQRYITEPSNLYVCEFKVGRMTTNKKAATNIITASFIHAVL